MKIPVIILNYNSSDDCRKCVSFLKRQEGVDLEIILVDNCSPDRDKVETLSREQGCTFIASPENRGYNAGNNIGLRYAAKKGYEFALIANPDMEFPDKKYIITLVEAMNLDEETVIVSSDIIGADGNHQNPLKRDGKCLNNFLWIIEQLGFYKKYDYLDKPDTSHYCKKVSGCCLMVRIDFIQKIGFFDEYPFLYCEEPILSRQVERARKRIFYVATVRAVHHHIASTKGDPVKRFQEWKRSRLYFIKNYSGSSWIGKRIAYISIALYVILYTYSYKLRTKRICFLKK